MTSANRSLSVCFSVCLRLASAQLLHNCLGENLLAVQTGRHHRGLEADGYDPHTEASLQVAVSLSPSRSHTVRSAHVRGIRLLHVINGRRRVERLTAETCLKAADRLSIVQSGVTHFSEVAASDHSRVPAD